MRVLFPIFSFLHYTSELTNALVEAGHEVIVLARDSEWDFVGGGADTAQEDYRALLDSRITLEWITVPKKTTLKTLPASLMCVGRMWQTIRKYKPDVLHFMDGSDYRLCALAALTGKRYPMVLTVHDATIHPGDKTNKTAFLRPWLRQKADGIVVHGDEVKRRLMDVGGIPEDRIHRMYRGPYVMYNRWKTGVDGDKSGKVLFFGRVSKYKGLDYLIEAAPKVCSQVPNAKFVIAGSGPDWPRCKSLIKNPEIFIIRDEKIPEPEVTGLFEESSIVVLPYIEASQSGVLAIAFALKKPVVITNVGALPEVVDDGRTGIIIPPGDVDALTEAIVRLLSDDALRRQLADNAYERVMNGDLSWSAMAEKTGRLYQDVMNMHRSKS